MAEEITQERFQYIDPGNIDPSPFNPRKRFEGPAFDELKESIRQKGLVQPIVVRPFIEPKTGDHRFQLVAGERRLRAFRAVMDEGEPITAYIKELTDDEAYEIGMIENLHRQDLTPLEEAESFKEHLKLKGEDGLDELCGKTGFKQTYVRRRIQILGLPKHMLKSWEKEEITLGHLEQLMRVTDKDMQKDLFDRAINWGQTVKQLKERIDEMSLSLTKVAKFDTTECGSCSQNTDVQKSLFGLDSIEALCTSPVCFKEKQRAYFTENFKKHYRRFGTTGFKFHDQVGYGDWEYISHSMKGLCKGCEHFMTLISLEGRVYHDMVCMGDKTCYRSKQREASGTTEKKPARKRDWHGVFFREMFFKEEIPRISQEIGSTDLRIKQLALAALIHGEISLYEWIEEKKPEDTPGIGFLSVYSANQLIKWAMSLDEATVDQYLKEVAIIRALENEFGADTRRTLGETLGLDLQRDWRIHEEYLKKKTRPEIITIIEKFGILEKEEGKAKKYLKYDLKAKPDKLDKCRKKDLVAMILESGIDLAGIVPDEILGTTDEPEEE